MHFESPRDHSQQSVLFFPPEGEPKAVIYALHGLQSHSGWYEYSGIGDALAKQGIAVFAIDRRGSGESSSPRGDAQSADQILNDLSEARNFCLETLRRIYSNDVVDNLKQHLLAASFAVKIAIPYLTRHKGQHLIDSLILMSPALFVRPDADFPLWQRLLIFFSSYNNFRFRSPLRTHFFTSHPDHQDFVKHDEESGHSVLKLTRRFLIRVAAKLTRESISSMHSIDIPTLLVMNPNDIVVDTDKILGDFFNPLAVEDKKLVLLPCEAHSLELSDKKDELFKTISEWVTLHAD